MNIFFSQHTNETTENTIFDERYLEELIPLIARLSEKYTSKESCSISYERAAALTEAIHYCIELAVTERSDTTLSVTTSDTHLPLAALYERGSLLVMEKARRARELYDELMNDFDDFGCRHYFDTIRKAMPEFFLHYDPLFAPQNHLLTLDYPSLGARPSSCGVALILDYLEDIIEENRFLHCFTPHAVTRLLRGILPEYRTLYLDNICEAVLLQAIGCVIAERPVTALELQITDLPVLQAWLDDARGNLNERLRALIHLICTKAAVDETHFLPMADYYATRLQHAAAMYVFVV
ncbi:MAG: hypothetical protein IJY09_03265 [Lachnospiraceae bacterium]|nr:hypothetical protein [Lachnospiraceae bacterium]